jgi:hypothetical protein
MKKPSRRSKTAQDEPLAEEFTIAIRALGDYAHVNVRPHRGLLYIYADERDDLDDPADAVARLHPLGDGTYRLSFHSHTGRWEPMPFSGDLTHITVTLVETLSPYLAKWGNDPGTSGSHH